MKYPQHVIDYAIDNKVSLEEAHKHFILNGKADHKQANHSKEPKIEFDIEEEKQFLSELEQDILKQSQEQTQSAADEQWWKEWKAKMARIEEMEKELGVERADIITKEEYDWVEKELKECDELYDEMYGKDM
jgi:predicted proteasome-type protease